MNTKETVKKLLDQVGIEYSEEALQACIYTYLSGKIDGIEIGMEIMKEKIKRVLANLSNERQGGK